MRPTPPGGALRGREACGDPRRIGLRTGVIRAARVVLVAVFSACHGHRWAKVVEHFANATLVVESIARNCTVESDIWECWPVDKKRARPSHPCFAWPALAPKTEEMVAKAPDFIHLASIDHGRQILPFSVILLRQLKVVTDVVVLHPVLRISSTNNVTTYCCRSNSKNRRPRISTLGCCSDGSAHTVPQYSGFHP